MIERKTIGALIAKLRKERGMTQKQLGDLLYVSDKTVSRWEHDECLPELSLIPVLAEIFEITSDELIRGERNPAPSVFENEEEKEPKKEDISVQWKYMLQRRYVQFENTSFVSIGLVLFGVILGLLCNFAFSRALLGFCLGSVFFVAAVLCEICFLKNALYKDDEETEEKQALFLKWNTKTVLFAKKFFLFCLCAFSFVLPMGFYGAYYGGYVGVTFPYWFVFAAFGSVVLYFVGRGVYYKYVCYRLEKAGYMEYVPPKVKLWNGKVFKNCCIPAVCIAICFFVIGFCISSVSNVFVFCKAREFSSVEAFKEVIEKEVHVGDVTVKEEIIFGDNDEKTDPPKKEVYYLFNDKGEEICEFEWNNKSIVTVIGAEDEDGLPIVTYTKEELEKGSNLQENLCTACVVAIILDFIIFVVIYFVVCAKKKS